MPDAIATALTATAPPGTTLNWYTVASGGIASQTAPTPSTAVVDNTSYYVSAENTVTLCEGPRSVVVVSVKPIPAITLGAVVNPTTCNAPTGSISVTGLTANTTYTVNYTKNGNTQTFNLTSDPGGVITLTSLSSGAYTNITVTLAGCSSNSINPVSLSDPNPPAKPGAGSNSPICSGAALNLNATSATAGVSYTWSGPNGYTSNLQNPVRANAQTTWAELIPLLRL